MASLRRIAIVGLLLVIVLGVVIVVVSVGQSRFIASQNGKYVPGHIVVNDTHVIPLIDYCKRFKVMLYRNGEWVEDYIVIAWWYCTNESLPPLDLRIHDLMDLFIARLYRYMDYDLLNGTINDRIPSFTDVACDRFRGIIYVFLTDLNDSSKVLEALNPIPSSIKVKFIQSKYTFKQLSSWKKLITRNVLENEEFREEVGLTSVGFTANSTISIGIRNFSYVKLFAEKVLKRYNIPFDAVIFEEEGIVEPSFKPSAKNQ